MVSKINNVLCISYLICLGNVSLTALMSDVRCTCRYSKKKKKKKSRGQSRFDLLLFLATDAYRQQIGLHAAILGVEIVLDLADQFRRAFGKVIGQAQLVHLLESTVQFDAEFRLGHGVVGRDGTLGHGARQEQEEEYDETCAILALRAVDDDRVIAVVGQEVERVFELDSAVVEFILGETE